MSIRAVYFDLGGVILRTEYQAPREHLAERLNMTYEDLNKVVFASKSSEQASIGTITTNEHWAAVTRRLRRPASETETIRQEFFAGDIIDRELLAFIRTLRPRYKVGLISNAWPDLRDYIVESKFDDVFDVLTISAEVGVMKPDPKIYRTALEELGVRTEETVFVDDMPVNVEGARALGMHAILFENRGQTIKELKSLLEVPRGQ